MRFFLVLLIAAGLSACASMESAGEALEGIKDYFLGGEDNAEPPTPLVELTEKINVEILWKESVGVGADEKSLKLVPAVGAGRVVAADTEGLVEAHRLGDGDLIWETETEYHFSGGPGLGNGTVILGTTDAEVVALRLENGEKLWTASVPGEVLSIPAVAKGIVLVRCADGSITALNEITGAKIWSYERSVPALSIRGTGAPIIVEDNAIFGEDNGKLIALRLSDGKFTWEAGIVVAKGRSEIERLVDLDVDPVAEGGVIYIASYHGGVGAVSELDGYLLWRNEQLSSNAGLSIADRHLYVTDSDSNVLQLDDRSGSSLWKQKELQYRKLTAPAAYGNYVVVGDLEGYVHWLSNSDGRQLGRVQITDGPIDAKAVVADNTVYVYAKDGTLAALKVR
ncbi:outer membrane protein assembly factor BamB [Methylomicrobium sp. Wu6]|uniref:outer membrane protein assembly factor BamB n=1 Tax=Methylomicrobium sp. Wu6 TaxID=3107928 RepID=UPI002DD6A526|nr:outer membrane protein assembly factor BamB [Methylomicrobium sp. Wu6]MEC4747357.1 outer membrane protein assembly factor BamB [Methylomicrobium sp. Wu6]